MSLEEERKIRNSKIIPAMIEAFKISLPRIEKVLKDLDISTDQKYIFGEKLSVCDLYFLRLKVIMTGCELNKDWSLISWFIKTWSVLKLKL